MPPKHAILRPWHKVYIYIFYLESEIILKCETGRESLNLSWNVEKIRTPCPAHLFYLSNFLLEILLSGCQVFHTSSGFYCHDFYLPQVQPFQVNQDVNSPRSEKNILLSKKIPKEPIWRWGGEETKAMSEKEAFSKLSWKSRCEKSPRPPRLLSSSHTRWVCVRVSREAGFKFMAGRPL